jgi:hypothetical protein
MSRFIITLLSIHLIIYGPAKPLKAQVFERVPELHGDIVIFPITLINVYPFISGSVNGIEGKFMFDTGFGTAIIINDNFVKLTDKKRRVKVWPAAASPI